MELPVKNKRHFIILANVCRWLLALVLVLSGFLKALDPVAGMYKLQEYVSAFSLPAVSDGWLLTVAVVQAAVEFLIGLFLFVGIYRRFIPFVALVMMLLFTPFTFYLWISGIVTDCGCFGESVMMSNGATLAKNVVLLIFAIFAFAGRSSFIVNISHRMRWVLVVFSLWYIFIMQATALRYLPLADWSNFAVGNNIRAMVEYVPGDYRYVAVYEKDGEESVFPADAIPGDDWTFVRVDQELVSAGVEPVISNFSIVDWENDIEMADGLLADTGYVCIVSIEDVRTASVTHVDRINDLYDHCIANGVRFCAVSSSDEDELLLWTKRTGAEYPMCWADKALLRSMIHSNPGLLLLKDGVVVGKWAVSDIPDTEELENSPTLMPDALHSPYDRVKSWPFWAVVLYVSMLMIAVADAFLAAVDYGRRWLVLRKEAAAKSADKDSSDIS